ncbi:MAG: hypothetical protein JXR76_15835 [Deltaproteobacteria bacterium]|nr:hypothetical protein [Deltaproteobacteria bacterium]
MTLYRRTGTDNSYTAKVLVSDSQSSNVHYASVGVVYRLDDDYQYDLFLQTKVLISEFPDVQMRAAVEDAILREGNRLLSQTAQ